MALPILLDCDPGHDDAIAIVLALASPELDVKAITSSAGNQTPEKTLRNVLRMLTLLNRTDIPVAGGDGGGSGNPADYYRRIYYHPLTGEYIPGGWLYYTNPNVPWSLNFNYSFSMSRSYSYANNQLSKKDNYTQTLGVQGNIQLTPKMSVQAQSGWDFTAMKMTTTQFSFRYDLHCFNISVSWVPSGMYQSYSFLISANAAALADLLRFKKSTSYWDK